MPGTYVNDAGDEYTLEVLSVLRSPQDFAIVPIHYTHDPEKGMDWRNKEILRYQSKHNVDWQRRWNQEQEIDFTEVTGAVAYTSYGAHNELKGILLNPALPICIAMDFNVEPMTWEIFQIRHEKIYFFDEIVMSPCPGVDHMVREFRNRYPNHPHELWIYGDSTGMHRVSQTGKSDYAAVMLEFRGYSSPIQLKVPVKAPYEADRIAAFNRRLKGADGEVFCYIDPDKCPELIKDLKEVKKANGKIVKERNREKMYFYRTHASDAAGYPIAREWPVLNELVEQNLKSRKKPKKRHYKRILGKI